MKQRNEGGLRRKSWGSALLALWLAACGGAVGQPTVGGESHFLRHCGDGCGTGLECVSDICTRSCRVDEQNSCERLSSAARCTNASIEPGAIAVCDQACQRPEDCRALGGDFTCDAGYCRGPALHGGPTGSAGASGAPGGSGGGSGQPQGGGSGQPQGSGGSGQPQGSGGEPAGGGGAPPAPPELCELPFETGVCEAAFAVFAAVNGVCLPQTYGGCGGNANLFSSLEECQSVCEQRPSLRPCTGGRVEHDTCIACGSPGGCGKTIRACAQPCDEQTVCDGRGFSCSDGVCQQAQCI